MKILLTKNAGLDELCAAYLLETGLPDAEVSVVDRTPDPLLIGEDAVVVGVRGSQFESRPEADRSASMEALNVTSADPGRRALAEYAHTVTCGHSKEIHTSAGSLVELVNVLSAELTQTERVYKLFRLVAGEAVKNPRLLTRGASKALLQRRPDLRHYFDTNRRVADKDPRDQIRTERVGPWFVGIGAGDERMIPYIFRTEPEVDIVVQRHPYRGWASYSFRVKGRSTARGDVLKCLYRVLSSKEPSWKLHTRGTSLRIGGLESKSRGTSVSLDRLVELLGECTKLRDRREMRQAERDAAVERLASSLDSRRSPYRERRQRRSRARDSRPHRSRPAQHESATSRRRDGRRGRPENRYRKSSENRRGRSAPSRSGENRRGSSSRRSGGRRRDKD